MSESSSARRLLALVLLGMIGLFLGLAGFADPCGDEDCVTACHLLCHDGCAPSVLAGVAPIGEPRLGPGGVSSIEAEPLARASLPAFQPPRA